MTTAVTTSDAEPSTDQVASPRPRPRWQLGLLIVLVAGLGAFAAVRVADRLDRPAAGDRYAVAYDGEDGCATVRVVVDGLIFSGQTDLSKAPVTDGDGALVIDRVWDLRTDDGVGVSATLTLADGTDVEVRGGTEGKVFFTLGCAIRN